MKETSANEITIFTPTYNRGYILGTLYNSLKNQTDKNFEWLIVDDGSKDETESLVLNWQKEKAVNIRYIKQKNGGKMKAHNVGVKECNTELFVCVDSDDWLLSDSVEKILHNWNMIDETEKNTIAGFIAYRGKNENEVIGNHFPEDVMESSLLDLYANGFRGDTTLVFRTDVIKQYPFPIIEDEKFITEAFTYEQIDRKYTYKLIPEIMIVCEYRNDGLTLNLLKNQFESPCGYTAYFIQKANFSKGIKNVLLNYARANCFRSKIKGKKLPVTANNKLLYNLMYPFGLILYLIKKHKYKR